MLTDFRELMSEKIKKSGIQDKLMADKAVVIVQEEIERVLSQAEMRKVRALYIKKGVVTVASLDDEAIKSLKLREKEVVDVSNAFFGVEVVKKLRYIN